MLFGEVVGIGRRYVRSVVSFVLVDGVGEIGKCGVEICLCEFGVVCGDGNECRFVLKR